MGGSLLFVCPTLVGCASLACCIRCPHSRSIPDQEWSKLRENGYIVTIPVSYRYAQSNTDVAQVSVRVVSRSFLLLSFYLLFLPFLLLLLLVAITFSCKLSFLSSIFLSKNTRNISVFPVNYRSVCISDQFCFPVQVKNGKLRECFWIKISTHILKRKKRKRKKKKTGGAPNVALEPSKHLCIRVKRHLVLKDAPPPRHEAKRSPPPPRHSVRDSYLLQQHRRSSCNFNEGEALSLVYTIRRMMHTLHMRHCCCLHRCRECVDFAQFVFVSPLCM